MFHFKILFMKKILVALDFSTSAHLVAEQGQVLAKNMNAELYLVHVLADWSYYIGIDYSPVLGYTSSDFGAHQAVQHEDLTQSAYEYLEKTQKYLNHEPTSIHILEGQLHEEINQLISDQNIDYLVIGSHSRSKFDSIFMGSNTEKLMKNVDIPILIVPIRNE